MKEGRDTRYNFEHNLFARVYICARIGRNCEAPFCPSVLAPAPSLPLPLIFSSNLKRGSLFLRNMHEYALSGFILHVPRKGEGSRGTRELHRKWKDRFVVTSISKTTPLLPSRPRSHFGITKFLFFLFFFVHFQTRSSHESLRSHVQRSNVSFSLQRQEGKVNLKCTSIFSYIQDIHKFLPFKNLVYLSRNKRYAGQLNNLGERLAGQRDESDPIKKRSVLAGRRPYIRKKYLFLTFARPPYALHRMRFQATLITYNLKHRIFALSL